MGRSKERRVAVLGSGVLLAITMVAGSAATAAAAPANTGNVLHPCWNFTGICNGVGTGTCNLTGLPQGLYCP